MTIEKFDREKLAALRVDIENALRDIEQRHGIKISLGRINYDATSARAKLEAHPSGFDPDKENFERFARVYGMDPAWFGESFKSRGTPFRITGFNPNARAFPVIAEKPDGAQYKFRSETIIRAMENR